MATELKSCQMSQPPAKEGLPAIIYCKRILESTKNLVAVSAALCALCEGDKQFFYKIYDKTNDLPKTDAEFEALVEKSREKANKNPKPPSVITMAAGFAKAMAKWASSGFKMVSKKTYFERRKICYDKCKAAKRCPYCGCYLWGKAAIVTEICPHPEGDQWAGI